MEVLGQKRQVTNAPFLVDIWVFSSQQLKLSRSSLFTLEKNLAMYATTSIFQPQEVKQKCEVQSIISLLRSDHLPLLAPWAKILMEHSGVHIPNSINIYISCEKLNKIPRLISIAFPYVSMAETFHTLVKLRFFAFSSLLRVFVNCSRKLTAPINIFFQSS